jgi:hypothetical protein
MLRKTLQPFTELIHLIDFIIRVSHEKQFHSLSDGSHVFRKYYDGLKSAVIFDLSGRRQEKYGNFSRKMNF